MRIHNIEQLASYVGVPSCFTGDYGSAISRLLYKYTECGCTFGHDQDGVYVSGYAEGADAECEQHYLEYPFSGAAWDEAVEEADAEGCDLWYEWHVLGDDTQDIIDDDNAQRAADMNATLQGGW